MKRIGIWALAGFAIACSHGPRPQASPTPATLARAADTASAAAPTPTAVARTPTPQDTSPATRAVQLLGDSAGTADSAADAAILEQLATSHPEPHDSGADDASVPSVSGGANAVATSEVSYDIDVSTYGSHSRVKYYLDFFQGAARERMSVWLQRMPRYEPMIRSKLREYQVPEDMVYLALIESGYSNSATSRARASGMWQFMKGTAKLYGLRIDSWVDERRDPVRATDAAARHLADLRDQFGSMYLAAAAYNAGAGKVGRGLRRLGPDDEDEEDDNPDATFFRLYDTRFLRRETKDYVPKLIAAALIAKQPEKYGFERATGIEPLVYDSLIVPDATGLDVLARLADTSVSALRDLNPQYIRLVTPPRRESVVRLPVGTGPRAVERFAALPAKGRVSYVDHTVARGQTLGAIARMYRVSTSLISDANPGVRTSRLRQGTHLLIPTSYVPVSAAEPAVTAGRVGIGHGGTTIRYRVRNGESLWILAGRYNTTVEKLRSLNALSRGETLRAGQVIRVPAAVDTVADPGPSTPRQLAQAPAAGPRTHLVRRGETLSSIASKYGIGLTALQSANGLDEGSVLKAGTRLVIPD
jgi:membrane-bound lytic murein transglycosylase D